VRVLLLAHTHTVSISTLALYVFSDQPRTAILNMPHINITAFALENAWRANINP